MFLAIYDQKDKLVLYRSEHQFDEEEIKKLSAGPLAENEDFEYYTDENYNELDGKVKTSKLS